MFKVEGWLWNILQSSFYQCLLTKVHILLNFACFTFSVLWHTVLETSPLWSHYGLWYLCRVISIIKCILKGKSCGGNYDLKNVKWNELLENRTGSLVTRWARGASGVGGLQKSYRLCKRWTFFVQNIDYVLWRDDVNYWFSRACALVATAAGSSAAGTVGNRSSSRRGSRQEDRSCRRRRRRLGYYTPR